MSDQFMDFQNIVALYKYIKFGQKGVKTNQTAGQREAFKSRHAKNIKKGKMSAAYWADKVKWFTKCPNKL